MKRDTVELPAQYKPMRVFTADLCVPCRSIHRSQVLYDTARSAVTLHRGTCAGCSCDADVLPTALIEVLK